jgi:hypothetical protein
MKDSDGRTESTMKGERITELRTALSNTLRTMNVHGSSFFVPFAVLCSSVLVLCSSFFVLRSGGRSSREQSSDR